MSKDDFWPASTTGQVRTPHPSDGDYSSKAKLTHDSPPDQETVRVELLEDFYCCSAGDVIETQRYLFRPS